MPLLVPPPENGDRETSTPIYHLLIMHYYPIISMKWAFLKNTLRLVIGCPSKILHISLVSLLGLTITSTEIENKEYYGIFGKAYFWACSLEVILQGNH